MNSLRKSAVAGRFYPGDAGTLRRDIEAYLQQVKGQGGAPKAMIVPHAGYMYSGPIAASAYARLHEARDTIRRVVLLGPAHHVPLRGLGSSSSQAFETPLGSVPLDVEALRALESLPQVRLSDEAHAPEHSLEVQLPFLQIMLSDFNLVPLVVGHATPAEVAEVLEQLWGGPETLIVISSDLSHYQGYATAAKMDRSTSEAIEGLRHWDIGVHSACGRHAIGGLLELGRKRGLKAKTIDLRNSGDTAGPRDAVVGYGAYVFSE